MPYLRASPLDPASLLAAVSASGRGGTCSFVGSVRDRHEGRPVVGIDYSAYGPMAEVIIGEILAEAELRWPVRVAAEHRVGGLVVGEAAVVVTAAGAHRDEAFAACRYVIEELKRRVPIWKRERYADGSESWVDPTAGGGPG